MKLRHLAGIALIAAVLATTGWLVSVSPGYQSTLRAETLDRPTAISCVWSQPWADPAFVMDGWSQPQPWWHEPETKVLWSNARSAQIMFRLPPGHARHDIDIGIEYAAVSAPVDVVINKLHAGMLERNATGDQDPYLLSYKLSSIPADGVIDIRFLVSDASLHMKDGRYLGVLLKAVRTCPAPILGGLG